ncbi:MAG TPA: hypothetical protein VGE81_04025 [Candidatus Limnocylindrales bacterium]
MSRREAWISAAAIFLVALAVRAAAAAAVSFPVPEDTAYYAGVARNLVEGRGLISDALWSYQTQPLVVPRAAFEVWMPLPALLAAIPMAAAGAANWFRAAQVMSVLASSAVAVLAWRLGADLAAEMQLPVGRARSMGIGTGLVAAVLGPLTLYGALPDSTALFAAFSLAACLLMTRIAAREAAAGAGRPAFAQAAAGASPAIGLAADAVARFDRRLVALGALLGLAALTRSEAIWLALAWAAVAWFWTPGSRRRRLGLIAAPAVVAILIFAPWAARDWQAFGTPLPGQTLANALYVHDYDVFAYLDQPSLANYLAQGPLAIAGAHLGGIAHDLFSVLLIPAFPVGLAGLLSLPWVGRRRALRPLVLASVLTFLVTSLVFPVATLSGTYLHAAGPALVLLTVCCMAALDSFIVRVGKLRGWTRPVAWLGPAFAIAAVGPLCVVTITSIARQADDVRSRYEALPAAMARAGAPLDGAGPVITDNPIWLAESTQVEALALPEESPVAVLDLARHFGAKLLIVHGDAGSEWPDVLNQGGTAAKCFQEVPLTDSSGAMPAPGSALAGITVFRIVCP